MESYILKEIILFDGQSDFTFYELKTWKSAMFCMVTANESYCEKMKEAAGLLFTFSELCRKDATKGNNSQNAAVRISRVLTKIHNLHKDVFGDFEKFTSPQGPFGDLIRSTDHGFGLLQKRATAQLKAHEQSEKRVAKAWKYYVRRVKKMEKVEAKFSKTLNEEQMNKEYRFIAAKQKLKHAVFQYKSCSEREVGQREELAKQTMAIKEEFLQEEENKLDVMFTFINDALRRLERLVPKGLDPNEELNFEPEVARTKAMAKSGWEMYLKQHTFPEPQVCELQISKRIVDVFDNDVDGDEAEEDEDEYSDDEDEDEIADISQQNVESRTAPKVNKTRISDVLQEILDSLDDDIKERSQTGRKSPQSVKERSRDSSGESEKSISHTSVIRRQRSRASSPVPRKRKPLRESPKTRKGTSPNSSQQVVEEKACGSRHESRKYTIGDSSPNQRGKRSRKPSSQVVIEDVTDEETSSPSPRGMSSKRESLERSKNEEISSGQRRQSQREARSRRRQSCDGSNSTIVQDFQDEVKLPPDSSQEAKTEESSYSSHDSSKYRICDSSPNQRRQISHKPRSQAVCEDVADRETCSSLPRDTSSKRDSVERHKDDEVISGLRGQSHREARSRRRQSFNGSKTTIVQKFEDVAELPPARAKNQWVGTPAPDIDVLQKNTKTENMTTKEVTAVESKTESTSGSRQRMRAAKESNSDLDETRISTLPENKPQKDKVSTPQDSPGVEVPPVVRQSNIYVYVLQGREKQNPGEISIRAGMKLKQLHYSKVDGMAYGYKKTKYGLKKYGSYPASLVTLTPPDEAEK